MKEILFKDFRVIFIITIKFINFYHTHLFKKTLVNKDVIVMF